MGQLTDAKREVASPNADDGLAGFDLESLLIQIHDLTRHGAKHPFNHFKEGAVF